jgi:pantetheine-phosphate adenylyltransferase
MAIALYGLSADPPTLGHQHVIDYGAKNYEQLIVALADNPTKRYTFTPVDRFVMVQAMVAHKNVKIVEAGHEFLVDTARKHKATVLLRGIRNNTDAEYERAMAEFNAWLAPGIQTVWVGPPPNLPNIVSSTFVKGLVGLDGWRAIVSKLVHPAVMPYLQLVKP